MPSESMSGCICNQGFGMNLSCPEHGVSDRPAPGAAGPSEEARRVAAHAFYAWGDLSEQERLEGALYAAYAVDFPARPTGGERARALEEAAQLLDSVATTAETWRVAGEQLSATYRYAAKRIRALAGTPERGER